MGQPGQELLTTTGKGWRVEQGQKNSVCSDNNVSNNTVYSSSKST